MSAKTRAKLIGFIACLACACAQPPRPYGQRIGDCVRLNSGGEIGTVTHEPVFSGAQWASVAWPGREPQWYPTRSMHPVECPR